MSIQDWPSQDHARPNQASSGAELQKGTSDSLIDDWDVVSKSGKFITKEEAFIGTTPKMHSEPSSEEEYTLLDFANEFEASESDFSANDHRDAISNAEEIQEEEIEDLFGNR